MNDYFLKFIRLFPASTKDTENDVQKKIYFTAERAAFLQVHLKKLRNGKNI